MKVTDCLVKFGAARMLKMKIFIAALTWQISGSGRKKKQQKRKAVS